MNSGNGKIHVASTKNSVSSNEKLHEIAKILFFQETNALAHAFAVLVTVWFLWNSVINSYLMIWAGAMLGQTIFWQVVVLYYRHTKPSADKTKIWMRYYMLAGATVGSGWGITTFWPGILDNPTNTIFLAIMVLGVVTAALGTFAAYLRSYLMLVGCALFPFVFRFFLANDHLHSTIGVMFLLYMFAIVLSGNNMRRAVSSTIALRFENIELVKDLQVKNIQAERARAEAEQANISKSKFLAAASHDLRQPLHALGLFVDVLESRIRYPEVRSIVDNIKISTEALAELFNALLDISKLDAGVLEPKLADIALQPLLQRMQIDYGAKAESKGITLRIRECHAVIRSDPAMFERILRNLLSNAIRYTHVGGVLLGCRRHGKQLSMEIYDTGVGIAADKIDKVFEEFYQIENPERDRRKGLGLGLAIVKRLSKLLGHRLDIFSVIDKGTRFRVTVPFVTAEPVCEYTESAFVDDVKDTRVLIIDDEAMIRTGMRDVLRQWGCQVIEAESAPQALDLLTVQHLEPDIILSDYRLREDQTGIEAIQLIRQAFNKPIPAILITGDTAPDRLREAKASGLHLLHKPVSPAKLRSLLCYLLEKRESG